MQGIVLKAVNSDAEFRHISFTEGVYSLLVGVIVNYLSHGLPHGDTTTGNTTVNEIGRVFTLFTLIARKGVGGIREGA